MKENFGIDSLPSIPSTEGNSQLGRFDDLENLNSLTKSSLELGLWGFFSHKHKLHFALSGLFLYVMNFTVTFSFIMMFLI